MTFDIIVIIGYFLIILGISFKVNKTKPSEKDAITGGKGFGLITAAFGRTANMAGGPATLGNGSYGFNQGINGIWFSLANIFSMWLSAPFASQIYRTMKATDTFTIGGYIGYRFGRFSQVFAGLTNFLAYLGFVASNILATGTVLSFILKLDLRFCVLVSMIIISLYTAFGGLKSVYLVNLFQISIMIVGFLCVLMPFTVDTVGGWGNMINHLPQSHTKLNWGALGNAFWSIILPTAVTGFTTQAGYIAISSSKNRSVGWKSTLLAGVIYGLIVFPILIVGAASFLIYPNADASSILTFLIREFLPVGLTGLLAASIISATMSTAASCTMNAITCLKIDVLQPFGISDQLQNHWLRSRNLIMLTNFIAVCFALLLPSVIKLLLIGYALATGGLLVPVFATIFWKRATPLGIKASMLIGGISFIIVQTLFPQIVPLLVSLPLSFIALILGSFLTPAQDFESIKDYFS